MDIISDKTNQLCLTLEGSGKTKEAALGNALSKLQKQIAKQIKGTLIRIEPIEIEFVEGNEEKSHEKFLFLFMKREVLNYTIKINVIVNVFAFDCEQFNFNQVKSKKRFYN